MESASELEFITLWTSLSKISATGRPWASSLTCWHSVIDARLSLAFYKISIATNEMYLIIIRYRWRISVIIIENPIESIQTESGIYDRMPAGQG